STTFFYGFREGRFRFCGTSAAAPHAAAVAALIRSANPGATNTQVRADLEATARPVGSNALGFYGPDAIGAGLVDADSAVAALALPPTVTISGPGSPTVLNPPTFSFVANRRATFTCSLDGASPAPCASSYTPPAPLSIGGHEFKVAATDVAGHTGTATYRFAIEKVVPPRPVVTIYRHPRKVVKTRKKSIRLEFGLRSSASTRTTFRCKIDKGSFKPCKANFSAHFKVGKHAFSAEAIDAAGTVSEPATFKFRVKRLAPHHRGHR
ncbi:MAG: S8 family serine peptidase, partial [Actinobacteria bacterium]|nr:S8 family serine peptidase [Actinomycetota bacterium]